MKRKLLSVLLSAVVVASMLTGCGSNGEVAADVAGTEEAQNAEGSTEETEEVTAILTVGPDAGTKMQMWSFVELHNTFYADMLNKWNETNPDRQIQITFTTYPYADMHNKMMLANQSGAGAPDLCDIEIGQFPNFMQGDVQFFPLNDALTPYKEDLVPARLEIYSKDGSYYGAPTHVGATVMYYNTKILEQYGIDYTKIETWADFEEAGKELNVASGGEVMMTSVDTAGSDWLWLAMAENDEDWTVADGGKANVNIDSVKKMLTMQQNWLNEGIAMVSPGGHTDVEESYQNIIDGKIAAFPKAMWYMSRFLSYMPEMTETWAIAPCPVFEKGQPRSVGIGGTGTVVSNQGVDPQLAADFITFAKCSYEGNVGIWEILGFDTCNTSIWEDEAITRDESNKFVSYFVSNPFDTLNEIKNEIGKIQVTTITPTIGEQINNVTLNEILEDGMDVEEALAAAQDVISIEQ